MHKTQVWFLRKGNHHLITAYEQQFNIEDTQKHHSSGCIFYLRNILQQQQGCKFQLFGFGLFMRSNIVLHWLSVHLYYPGLGLELMVLVEKYQKKKYICMLHGSLD